jgi:nucleoside-diphosphate-sugar epimerase
MKRLLLTGSSGLIGSNLTTSVPPDIQIITLDRHEFPSEKLGEFDYIIHSAGYAQPTKFLADEIATISVNTTMTMALFKRLKSDGKFLYMSSSEVYNGTPPPQNETQIGTTDPTHPRACYIEGKRCGEAICMAYRRLGYEAKIARLSLTYGGTRKGDTRALNHFIEQALTKKEIRLMDKGEAKRTYLYVDDAVKILWDILLKGTQPIYNVGGTSRTTIAELAYKIGELTGAEVILGDKGLAGAPDDVCLDMGLVLTEFGSREFTGLEEGLKKTIEWQKNFS